MTRTEWIVWSGALLNFLVFCVVATMLGGDAINGTVRNGHYYLMGHGVYHEVSHRIFV
jgi:hypothetical protein